MLDLVQRFAARLMNRVRVNELARGIRNGAPVVVKRRRLGSAIVIWFANRFLTLARSGIRMFVRADEWMEWEAYCSRLLYPDRPAVMIGPGAAVSSAEVPGASLRQLILRSAMDLKPINAAARELRRVHQLDCSYFRGGWSHGDMHLDNILYDPLSDCAILIDFDTRHESGLDEEQRHCDDLKVLLFELITLIEGDWPPLATAFIEGYREPAMLEELSRQLFVPRGFARILWYTRTNCWPIRRTEPRIERLRQIIQQVTAVVND